MVLRKSAHNFKDRKMAKRQFEAIVPAEAGWIVISIDTSAKATSRPGASPSAST
jgi:hypothetical protein